MAASTRPIEVTLHYDEALMLRATLLYWRKKLGRSFVSTTAGGKVR